MNYIKLLQCGGLDEAFVLAQCDDNGLERVVACWCRMLLINVPYKRTFGMPDQGQMLDV